MRKWIAPAPRHVGEPARRQRRERGFSFVELLLVIAIIAILSGILFPVFAQVRQAAQKTTCASNLRQLGPALQLYVNDYDDHWPSVWDGEWNSRAGEQLNWAAAVLPYVKDRRVFKCPIDPLDGVGCSYNANLWLHNRAEGEISSPSDCVVLMDGYTGEGPEYDPDEDDADPNSTSSTYECSIFGLNSDYTIWDRTSRATRPDKGLPRHNGTDNRLFADGHVRGNGHLKRWGEPGVVESLEGVIPFARDIDQTGGVWAPH